MIILFLIIALSANLFSQKQTFPAEVVVKVINASPTDSNHTFNLTKISTSYCFNAGHWPYEIFTECQNCAGCSDCEGGIQIISLDENGSYEGDARGYGNCAWGSSTYTPHLGYGLYKLDNETTDESDFVYLDFRDTRYGRYWVTDGWHSDMWIRYNGQQSKYEFDSDKNGVYELSVPFGGIIQIWRGDCATGEVPPLIIKSFDFPAVSDFPPTYFANSLGGDVEDAAFLAWGKEQNSSANKYKLFRKINFGIGLQWDYHQIGEYDVNTLYQYDKGISGGSEGGEIKYKLISYSNSTPICTTNVVTLNNIYLNWNNSLLLTKSNNHPFLAWAPYYDSFNYFIINLSFLI